MKKFCVFILFLIVVLAGAGFWGFQHLQQFVQQSVNVQNDQLLTIERGTTGNKLVSLLEKERILDNAALLPWLLKLHPELNKVKAGTYSLNGVKTVEDLLKLLNSGKEAQFSLTFVEGETFKTIRKRLENAPHLKQTLQGKSNDEVFGLLTMDTNLNKNLTESHIIDGWIVEKESGVAAERPQIASVFINRLNAKMKLQTDPTVIYGMGDNYNGNIRKKDLETPTPYNTYIIDGLPRTPIAMPSEEALQAVAHPAQTEFYYFVADGSGGHKFSRNLNEHNKAVQDYLRWYREQNRK